ncbi:unnamed protein product [Caretta caretta]
MGIELSLAIADVFREIVAHHSLVDVWPTPPAFGQPCSQTTIWSAVGGKGAKKYVLCLLVEDGAPSRIR